MAEQDNVVMRFQQSQAGLAETVSGLSDEAASEVWCGTWGVKQLIAHIAGWESSMSEALAKIARGERPTVDGIDLNDTDGSNAKFAQAAAAKPFNEVLGDLGAAGDRLCAAIQNVPDERFEEGRAARRICETMIRHPGEHREEIRAWRQSRGL